jgi:adenylate kinase
LKNPLDISKKSRTSAARGRKTRGPLCSVSWRIGITGSPGTGKKTIGLDLANRLGLELVSINDYAIAGNWGTWKSEEFEVDLKRLKGKIPTKNSLITGHLLPYVVPNKDLDWVFVLRCSPAVLRKRYTKRKYDEKKISENIEAEALGVISQKCLEVYASAKLAEVDTSRAKPDSMVTLISDIIIGKKRKSYGTIDWLSSANSPAALEMVMQGKYHTFNKTKKDN